MKKLRYVKLIGILIITLLCSGCVKFDGEMKIKNTKSMNLVITYAVDKSVIDNDVLSEDEKRFLLENGFSLKDYKKDNYQGVTLKYNIRNIDKVSSSLENKFSITSIKNKKISDMFTVKKNWFKNKYSAKFIFDATDVFIDNSLDENSSLEYLCSDGSVITINSGDEVPIDCHGVTKFEIENSKSDKPLSDSELNEKLSKDVDLKFRVKLANKVIDTNANDISKNKKTLTWNLSDTGITNINFDFELYNYFNIFITILFILIVVVILFIVFIYIKKHIRKIRKVKRHIVRR